LRNVLFKRLNKSDCQLPLAKWHDRVTTYFDAAAYNFFIHVFTLDGTHLYQPCSTVSLFTLELKIKENNIT